ncbi:terminase small subunit [Anaerotignum sp.]|uniref:terminase small subunit n=1 Tax=Anaerotignum sp. TaxID=2039241 RepID=UPI00331F215F
MSKSSRTGLPHFESKEQVEKLVHCYFEGCKGEILRDEYGSVVYQKSGEPTWIGVRPPTVANLAAALGFLSRQDFLNYNGKYVEPIAKARLLLEGYVEQRLYDKDGLQGAKFTLINNFQGWADKTKEDFDSQIYEKLDGILEGINNAAKQ